jgi:threonine dehydratase
MPQLVTVADVASAADRIRPHVNRTPVETSATVDAETGAEVFFKCENLQKVGAFKARGATNAVFSLSDSEAARGVVTHSSGNHGQALAYAAAIRGIGATVVMPDDAPTSKVDAVVGYGASIVFCPHGERESTTARVLGESGGVLVHPFDDPRVIAGQGTAAFELTDDVPDLDVVMAPVGGGGLMSGTAVVVRDRLPDAMLVAAEPKAADDAFRSLQSGNRQPAVADPRTIADGLRTGLSELTFAHLQRLGVEVVTVGEEAIVEAARFHLERMKLVVEPSGATALAALRRLDVLGKRVGVILSGGNTDFGWLEA